MEADKRRFLPGQGLKRITNKFDHRFPELEEDGLRLASKIMDLDLSEIKARIPRLIFSGILLAADALYNDGLRSNDPKKRKEAAAAFLNNLGSANFLKNMSVLDAGEEAKSKKKPKTVSWDMDKDGK